MTKKEYDHREIETKWQKKWEEDKIFQVKMNPEKPKYYVLEMYPYPSGSLHMGHLRNYSIGDSFARFKRMQGYNVLYPMGYDSFGLPAENAAIDHGVNPDEWTDNNIEAIKEQQKRIGLSYDWTRMIYSHDLNYYKWDQWFFLKMYEKELAYREDSYVNWCPKCSTVLANEQVLGGKCWRCGEEVDQQFLTQWFLKIKEYAEELLEGLNEVEWPQKVKTMQRNWIGRSEGTIIQFPIVGEERTVDIFTTRPDTVFGVTFMVFAPEHPWVKNWVESTDYEDEFNQFYKDVIKQNKFERTDIDIEKKGMFIGKHAKNPLTVEKIPIYVGNFVVYEYGAGAVMAVPGHDQRDFEFAKKYDIPIKVVIQPYEYEINSEKMTRAFEGKGVLANSGDFNGMENEMAKKAITEELEEKGMGEATVNYKLRNWLISRQRYWGCPIPIIYCEKCGTVPVPYEDLPVELPKDVKFTGKGNPLETSESFVNVKCPTCGKDARRETDTMDTFVDSSWYYFRFCDPNNKNLPYDEKIVNYWGNVNQYIGGIEHAILHLLYARFWTKVTRDLGLHNHNEPFQSLLTQGMINKAHPYCEECETFALKSEVERDKCPRCGNKYIMKSAKMSKSLGNTVDPIGIMEKYGADSARFFILFGASPDSGLEWSDEGVSFAYKFINNILQLLVESPVIQRDTKDVRDELITYFLHKTIKDVTESMNELSIRDAVNSIIQFTNELVDYKNEVVNMDVLNICKKKLIKLLHPIIPHLTEEIFESMGNNSYLSLSGWPDFDESVLNEENEFKWNLLKDVSEDIKNIKQATKKEELEKIKIIVAEDWKFEFYSKIMELLEETKKQGIIIGKIMQKDEFKPHGKFISQTVNKILKNVGKYAKYSLSPKSEKKFFQEVRPILKKNFDAEVQILKEKDTKASKAFQALPGRPAIIIS